MFADEKALVLYNSFTKREEPFKSLEKGIVKMYTCGPTVYGRPHIGNYSSFLMADLLRRWLEVLGYEVRHVKNITDVGHLLRDSDHGDDKVEREAEREKVHPLEIARRYTEQFLEDEKALAIMEPFARPKATETIPEMLAIIRELLKRRHAYETPDGIYFSVETFPAYGRLSGNTLANLSAGTRIAINEKKKHPADFALWKKTVGENSHHMLRWTFDSGALSGSRGEDASSGFPGWHIECSAMAKKILGDQLDIHTGGEDNIFPHHECEIAQSECSGPAPFVCFWLHKRRIDMGDAKMSKSLGNVLHLPDIVARGFSPLDLRYYLLSVHYRTPLKFAWKGLEDARKARRRIIDWMTEIQQNNNHAGAVSNFHFPISNQFSILNSQFSIFYNRFTDAMNSDLNTPAAIAAIFDCMTHTRRVGARSFVPLPGDIGALIVMIRQTFGCLESDTMEGEPDIPRDVQTLIEERREARTRGDFAASDHLRDAIRHCGYEVRDTSEGQRVRRM